MKMQLYTQGPFVGSISIYRDFLNFKGDSVYKKNSNDFIGGHAIEIIGWCNPGIDLRKGFEDGYWICKNNRITVIVIFKYWCFFNLIVINYNARRRVLIFW